MKYCKVIINGITIKDDSSVSDPKKIFSISCPQDESQPVGEATLECPKTISDLVPIQSNLVVQIYKSSDNSTFKRIFYGYIIDYDTEGAKTTINCKNQLFDLIRKRENILYDAAVSPTAGKLSAIANDLIETYGTLSASVQDSGDANTIDIFKCTKNSTLYDRVQVLKEALDWTLYFNNDTAVAHFEPRGFTDTGITLTTSSNIIGLPKWKIDTSFMINKLTVEGAVTDTLYTQSGRIGTTSGFTTDSILLSKTPISAEVIMDASNPPTTQLVGGSKDGSTGGSYWIDAENKKIMPFTAFTTNFYAKINYYWSSPTPIEMDNPDSITLYGLFENKMTFKDIKSVADAESRAANVLAKRSVPFYNCTAKVKYDQDLEIGKLVTVQDNISKDAVNGKYVVTKITYKYPSVYEEVEVGDKLWKLVDWQETTESRLARLEESDTTDEVLRILKQFSNKKINNVRTPKPRYVSLTTNQYNAAYAGSIWGNAVKPWGQGKWGAHSQIFTENIPAFVQQYLNVYTEKFRDTDFKDVSVGSNWDTTSKTLSFSLAAIDSYSESNYTTAYLIYSAAMTARAQTFVCPSNCSIDNAVFFMKKLGSPTGSAYCKIYAITGISGSTGKPTGSALATSDALNVATLTTSNALTTFTFSGANKISLSYGTSYAITVEFSGGSAGNIIYIGGDNTTPTHAGNSAYYLGSSWTAQTTIDYCFYLNGYATAKSSSIDYNNGAITHATLTADNSTNLGFQLTADGTNWENVTSGAAHNFTNTGSDLRWRAIPTGSASISSLIINNYH